ncbi:MAG: NifU family protein, partial [Kiritimatiellae bacterium]|nr:NifU family protein [Kiritimatiellia bacterium]
GGGCGKCYEDIAAIIARVRGEMRDGKAEKPKEKPMTNIEKIKLIEDTINREIRPALRQDGGDLDLIDVEGNRVKVSFRGSCAHCPMAQFTMKQVVESKLKEFVAADLVVEEVLP